VLDLESLPPSLDDILRKVTTGVGA
jgi:hypothetical protein